MGSVLVARELPEEGGDTLYANLYAAYETLSDGLKDTDRGGKPSGQRRLLHRITIGGVALQAAA